MVTRIRHINFIFAMLLLGSMVNEAWAAYKVKYHILTLPMNSATGNTMASVDGKRAEAVRTIIDEATTVRLPDHFKSPLAKNFTYYPSAFVTNHGATSIYEFRPSTNKYYLYTTPTAPYRKVTVSGGVKTVTDSDKEAYTSSGSSLVATSESNFNTQKDALSVDGDYYFKIGLEEGDAITANCDIYVTYEYDADNTIAKLDGSVAYNIEINGRFLAYNRGRNNRLSMIPSNKVTGEQLASDDFVKVNVSGTGITTYWSGSDNHNPKEKTESQFHFLFKYLGEDPYNITISTAYNKDEYYIEKYASSENVFVNKYYKGSTIFSTAKKGDNLLFASDDNCKYTTVEPAEGVTYESKPGYYRNISAVIWNSFALLNNTENTGYVFMGSRMVSNVNGNFTEPTKDTNGLYQYYYLQANNNELKYVSMTPAVATENNSSDEEMYDVKTYTFKVKTPFGTVISVEKEWSDAYASYSLMDNLPDDIKRKYVTFMGAYKDADLDGKDNNVLTTFAEADANGREIWLKYTSSMPFDALPLDGDYRNARWYTIRMNANENEYKYLAYFDSNNLITTDGSGAAKGSDSDSHLGEEQGVETQVAFMGDPFELKILSHTASEGVGNRYIGCATDATNNTTLNTNKTGVSDISTWEIVSDNVSGSMVLRQYGTAKTTPMYVGWNSGATNKPVVYSSTPTRIKVVVLSQKQYIYHIYNTNNEIAVKASVTQDIGKPLNVSSIPEIIRSPFLALPGVTVKFYYSTADALADTNAEPHAPFNATADSNKDIYVRYFGMAAALAANPRVQLNGENWNVQLNNQFIYYSGGNINTQVGITTAQKTESPYIWKLMGQDPYAMKIYNEEAHLSTTPRNVEYISTTFADNQDLTFDVVGNASLFIAKQGNSENAFEVMAATGDGVDASTTYYNIGRNVDNSIKMYSNASYAHGYAQLQFHLTPTTSTAIVYHLVDNSNTELLNVISQDDQLFFPTEYRSPLVDTYTYYASKADADNKENAIASIGERTDIYVRYTTKSVADGGVNLQKGILYLLEFNVGDQFRQENGSDDLLADPSSFEGTDAAKKARYQAVYPYCNGDCNFFIYGQEQYEAQQHGAASTRTRWVWYLESANNDPYHVKISSRQQETFPAGSDNNHNAYFRTYVQKFGGENHVVTTLAWPGITGEQGTEYMIMGSPGMYQLVTTETISLDINDDGDIDDDGESDERRTVKSFEQYWKTYDTIKNKLLAKAKDPSDSSKDLLDAEDKGANPTGTTTVVKEKYRDYLTSTFDFHGYGHWAYAKRFNGYNAAGETKKGWEQIEHWYQTVNMGEGYFNFVKTSVDPALILLDQHGWEIMRKPLPSSPDEDPEIKAAKYDALRAYDSPMVKEYIFWSSASKRTGLHQYYKLDKRIGGSFTSTTLTELPPYGSENVLDAKGNLNDQYVTYIVKDEYAQSYTYNSTSEEWEASTFLIQQGDKFVSTADGENITKNGSPGFDGNMPQYIINNAISNGMLWYLKPNTAIDNEQGYLNVSHDWGANPNAYEQDDYKYLSKAKVINDNTLGKFSFSNGFDPYNIQISSAQFGTKYFVTNATGAKLDNGDLQGTYNTTAGISLGTKTAVNATWYDNARLTITNATFMAVKNADGNIQLMPRFDHLRRVRDFGNLETPIGDADKLNEMNTQLFRPIIYNYHIIDNSGREALCYKGGGDLTPQTPEWFKSKLATDFKYYKTLTSTGDKTYDLETLADQITEEGSLAGAGLTASGNDGNHIYVRYSYDEDADFSHILKGNWFTMTLNEKDAIYSSGIKQAADSKPALMDATHKTWQWKFTASPQAEPDPYAVSLYNRHESGATTINGQTRFALLNYYDNGTIDPAKYTLVVAGTGNYSYQFVNGDGMTTSDAATTAVESGFTGLSCSYDGTKALIELGDDVEHVFTYHVYTHGENGSNDVKYGVEAISGTQTSEEVLTARFIPHLPEPVRSPLLEPEEFHYYETIGDMGNSAKELQYLYGLYDDDVYVRYNAYNPDRSTYKVPNDKDVVDGHVARGSESNDASLLLNGSLLYNIIWYNDNMMYNADGTNVKGDYNEDLKATPAEYVWQLEGDDPYAIKIKSHSDNQYIGSDGTLSATAQTFMLIPKADYDYGVLAVTGAKANKLTIAADDDNDATKEAVSVAETDTPTPFIIFSLATHKVIYHLVIAPTATNKEDPEAGCYETIPYWNGSDIINKKIPGSTQRDLTSVNDGGGTHYAGEKYQLGETINGQTYCYDAGHISLGDLLEVPTAFFRPNVHYDFYVEGIYNNDDCALEHAVDDLNTLFKGRKVDHMGDDTGLLGKTVRINIVYTFNGDLTTNSGLDFVRSVSDNKWYTFETRGETPWLAQFTNAWGLEVKEGRGTHYTNDYLWSPLGDAYGFRMYNRYIYKNSGTTNSGETNRVMTTIDNTGDVPPGTGPFAEEKPVTMTVGNSTEPTADPNNVYELLPGSSVGYFHVHPVTNNTGVKYYLRTKAYDEVGKKGTFVVLSETATDFTFSLNDELVKPYFDLAGYVGALKGEIIDNTDFGDSHVNVKAIATAIKNGTPLTTSQLMAIQPVIYNDDNIEPFASGYYRLHSPNGITGISGIRYASGYTHKREETDAVPMHFYEVEGTSTQFNLLKSKDGSTVNTGFTSSDATRGDIPILAVEYDPASIFYIIGADATNTKLSTQGLFLKGEKGQQVADADAAAEDVDERAKALMTSTEGNASQLWVMDIGGAVMLIHDRTIPKYRKYLSYDQTDDAHIYDLKLTHNTHTDHAKWCLQPANHLGLRITTHSGGDGGSYAGNTYYYSTFYAPFDILLPDDVPNKADPTKNDKQYKAFLCETQTSPWNDTELRPRSIDKYNIVANDCPVAYCDNNKYVPAGTPVIFSIIDNAGNVKVTLPHSSPHPMSSPFISSSDEVDGSGNTVDKSTTRTNTLMGEYLEQKLSAGNNIYVFGIPYSGTFTPAADYASTGNIEATLPLPDNSGWGFFLNSNPNRESDPSKGNWKRNNWYVYANKIYYRDVSSPAPGLTRGVEYVPILFDDQQGEEPVPKRQRVTGDDRMYDLSGRCVATPQQVADGSWQQLVSPGIYIVNGRKVIKR